MSDRIAARLVVALASLVGCTRSHPTAEPAAAGPLAPSDVAGDDEEGSLGDGALREALGAGRFAIRPGDHAPVRGSTHALVRIVVFQDFAAPEAPALAQAYGAALARWPDAVQLVLVHAPGRSRPMARPFAELAISAGSHGKFWEAHDLLLRAPPADRDGLLAAAASLQLDVEDVRAALADGRHRGWIDVDVDTARAHGVARGPAVFVNGLPAPRDPAELEGIVERELAIAQRIVDAGVPRSRLQSRMVAVLPSPPPAPEPDSVNAELVNWAVPAGDAPVLGPTNALVTVIVFADFQCPFCGRVQPVLAKLRADFPDDVRILFRHRPLPMHPLARSAAKAAIAADRQGKFWAMHDFLFGLKGAPDERVVKKAVKRLKLDKRRFDRDVRSAETELVLVQDERIGTQFAVQGTPMFFVNGRRLSGAQPFEVFQKLVLEELQKARVFAETDAGGEGTVYDRMILGFVAAPDIMATVGPM